MGQPEARGGKRLPEMDNWQHARERVLSIEGRLGSVESSVSSATQSSDTVYDDTILRRKVQKNRYDLDRHGHTASEISGLDQGDAYAGLFKISRHTDNSVFINPGYVALKASTDYVSAGELAIGATTGIHTAVLNVWFNAAWKWSITDEGASWPDMYSSIVDGVDTFDCYKKVIGLCQVADGDIVADSVIQIIHDTALNLIDWSATPASATGGTQFIVTKNAANEVAITSGVVISGTNVLQVSNTTEAVSASNGTYYLSLDTYYDLGAWTSEFTVASSYPVQAVDVFTKLIATIAVVGNEVDTISQTHPGDEVINPRVAE